jgi:hypothetical protein
MADATENFTPANNKNIYFTTSPYAYEDTYAAAIVGLSPTMLFVPKTEEEENTELTEEMTEEEKRETIAAWLGLSIDHPEVAMMRNSFDS